MEYTLSSSLVFLSLESKPELVGKVVHEPSKITFKILCACDISEERHLEFIRFLVK